MIDKFTKLSWTVPLKNKNAQTIKDSFGKILLTSKRSPNLIESDDGKEFVNKFRTDSLKKNHIKRSSRYKSLGAVFAEKFNCTVRDIFKKSVFQSSDGNWNDILPTLTKQYKNTKHSTTRLTPNQAFLKKEWRLCLL